MQNGNRVVFEKNGSFIENIQSGHKTWLREENGVYLLDAVVRRNNKVGFPRQGYQP